MRTSTDADKARPPIRIHLLLVAERLFAQHGLNGVSLRQISAEAGSNNSSVVQYHFGGKEELIREILRYRQPMLNQRRAVLEALLHPRDLRTAVEALLLPVVEQSEQEDSYYLSFLEQVVSARAVSTPFDLLLEDQQDLYVLFLERLAMFTPEVPEPLRVSRTSDVTRLCLHLCALRERSRRKGANVISLHLQANQLFDGIVGYLTAPVSAATLRGREAPFGGHAHDDVATRAVHLTQD